MYAHTGTGSAEGPRCLGLDLSGATLGGLGEGTDASRPAQGPAKSIVSTGTTLSRQGPAPDMSSASASPTLTALAISTPACRSPGPYTADLGCGHRCGHCCGRRSQSLRASTRGRVLDRADQLSRRRCRPAPVAHKGEQGGPGNQSPPAESSDRISSRATDS